MAKQHELNLLKMTGNYNTCTHLVEWDYVAHKDVRTERFFECTLDSRSGNEFLVTAHDGDRAWKRTVIKKDIHGIGIGSRVVCYASRQH